MSGEFKKSAEFEEAEEFYGNDFSTQTERAFANFAEEDSTVETINSYVKDKAKTAENFDDDDKPFISIPDDIWFKAVSDYVGRRMLKLEAAGKLKVHPPDMKDKFILYPDRYIKRCVSVNMNDSASLDYLRKFVTISDALQSAWLDFKQASSRSPIFHNAFLDNADNAPVWFREMYNARVMMTAEREISQRMLEIHNGNTDISSLQRASQFFLDNLDRFVIDYRSNNSQNAQDFRKLLKLCLKSFNITYEQYLTSNGLSELINDTFVKER
jgi:hypothetical protein